MFHMLTILEYPEPNWTGPVTETDHDCVTEIRFDVDEHIKSEVERVTEFVAETV